MEPRFFRRKLQMLYRQNIEVDRMVSFNDFKGLPEPVQAYLRTVLHEGMPYISSANVAISGVVKHGFEEDWNIFHGEEYLTAIRPGIVRNIRTKNYSETETFISGKGNSYKWDRSSLRTLSRKGKMTSRSQLLLWLVQAVWFPTSFLPNAYLSWEPFSSSCARATFKYRGIKVFFKAWFNDRHELYRIESLRSLPNGKPEKWVVKFNNYQMINAVYLPVEIEAAWIIGGDEFPYLKCELDSIEYDTPGISVPSRNTVRPTAYIKREVPGREVWDIQAKAANYE